MTSTAYPSCTGNVVDERLEVLFEELSELAGSAQRDRRAHRGDRRGDGARRAVGCDGCAVGGGVGGLEVGLLVGQRAHHHCRREPVDAVSPLRCGLAGGPAVTGSGRRDRRRAPTGSDEHYAELAAAASVSQLRTAIKLEPRPQPDPDRDLNRSARSAKPATGNPAPGRSPCPSWTRRNSMRRCSPTATR